MKLILITIISLLLISNIKNEYQADELITACIDAGNKSPSGKSDCNQHKLDDDLKCCFVKYNLKEVMTINTCVPIYDSLSSIRGYEKMLKEAKNVKIVCKSQFLKFSLSLFSIILLF